MRRFYKLGLPHFDTVDEAIKGLSIAIQMLLSRLSRHVALYYYYFKAFLALNLLDGCVGFNMIRINTI